MISAGKGADVIAGVGVMDAVIFVVGVFLPGIIFAFRADILEVAEGALFSDVVPGDFVATGAVFFVPARGVAFTTDVGATVVGVRIDTFALGLDFDVIFILSETLAVVVDSTLVDFDCAVPVPAMTPFATGLEALAATAAARRTSAVTLACICACTTSLVLAFGTTTCGLDCGFDIVAALAL